MKAAYVTAGVVLVAVLAVHAFGVGRVRIDMLDIGQGDAILVTDGSHQLLIDAGPDGTALTRLGSAMPFADRTLEYALITHPHRDHYEGLRWIAERYRIGTLLVAAFSEESAGYTEAVAMIEGRGGSIVHVAAGDRIDLGERLVGHVLWPEAGIASSDPNESSIVMTVHQKGESGPALGIFTGDATESVEDALVARDAAALRAHVLKAGHHGSKTSSSQGFVEAVAGEHAAVSVGEENGYGHPSSSVLRRLEAYGYRAWRTDLSGSIRITPEEGGVRVRSCRVFCMP